MLVLQHIEIASDSSVRSAGLDAYSRHSIVFMISITDTKFEYWEILILEIDPQICLILTVITDLPLDCTEEISAYTQSSKERNRVRKHLYLELLSMGLRRSQDESETNQQCGDRQIY